MSITGRHLAEVAASCLVRHGSRYLFGVPGGGNNLDVVGAAEEAGLHFILAHGETSAAIMAGTLAEITGTPCACVVTRGPGAASAVNGMAQAALDRQPLILLTDTVSQGDWQRISHQRIDQRTMIGPVSKWSTVLGGVQPELTMESALSSAVAPRPGPVHLDLDPTSSECSQPPPLPTEEIDESAIIALVKRSRLPLLVLGVGAKAEVNLVRALVVDSNVPVLETYKARGTIPSSWSNYGGLFTGANAEKSIFSEADLVIAVGLDAVELIPSAWTESTPILSLNTWPEDSPYWRPAIEYVGPLAQALEMVEVNLVSDWPVETARIRRKHFEDSLIEVSTSAENCNAIAPGTLVMVTREVAPAGSVATVDAGAHMLVAMPLWTVDQPNELLISSGLATMGYSLPASVAAALVHPTRRIFCFVGDGGLGMCLAELETLVRLNLLVTVLVFNDSSLSLIKAKQMPLGHGGLGAVAYKDLDFALIAKGFGMHGVRVSNPGELREAVANSLNCPGPALIDVVTDPTCYPDVIRVLRG